MKKDLHINREIKEELKENPFEVPENYFDHFDKQLRERIAVQERPIKSIFQSRILYSAAATVALLIIGTWFFILKPSNTSQDNANDLAVSDLVIGDFSEYDMLSFLENDSNLADISFDSDIIISIDEEDESSEIINYLVDNDVSVDFILEM